MEQLLIETFITLLVIIDPFGVLPVFVALTAHDTPEHRQQIAKKACGIALVILLAFAVIGDWLLNILHISEPSFRIAGGLLLLLTAIDMVVAKHSGLSSTTRAEEKEALHRPDITVFPLAIPLIAGPGALVSVVILTRRAEGSLVTQASVLGMMILVVFITYVCLRLSDPIGRILGVTGSNVLGRVFGIILAALAIQFILDGLQMSLGSFFIGITSARAH